MTFHQILHGLDERLNALACDQILQAVDDATVCSVLHDAATHLAAVADAAGGEAAAALRGVASQADGSTRIEAAMAVVTRFLSAGAAPVGEGDATNESDELAMLREDGEMAELFITEALDHLGTIEASLLALDEQPDDEGLLNGIFRPFHTIKGNAGALGLTSLQTTAHAVENLLDLARSGQIKVRAPEVDLILEAVDVLTAMINSVNRRLKNLAGDEPPDSQALIAKVERAIERHANATPEPDIVSGPSAVVGAPAGPPPGEPTEKQRSATASAAAAAVAIKVDTGKLDSLVDAVGELIIVQSLIQEDPALASIAGGGLARNLAQLKRITADLQRNAMALRMVPIRQAFQKVARAVRDLGRRAGKPVHLELNGEDTELDRKVVEDITDPLLHMVRNSVDHAIESVAEREQLGKSREARLTLSAYHQSGQVVIEISDDGRGLPTAKIRARAVERGLIAADATLTPEEIHELIFRPGFSTAEAVTEISGRGVGMDVVRRNVDALRGRIEIETEPGRGTTFYIKLPLTLAVLDALVVSAAGERFVLPTAAVRESLRPTAAQVHDVQGHARMVQVRSTLLPLISLGELFGLGGRPDPTRSTVLVIDDENTRVGLMVDELLSKQEVVIKSLGGVFAGVRGVAGGAILGDGRIGLILDPRGIVELLRSERAA